MQAHPVPQNIMQVEFQLVGLLTLRQFGYLAAAGILAWLIFITPIYLFVKGPIAVAVALFGLALAFLPINDMKFEKWVIAFFKAVYSPTRRVWFKEAKPVDFLTDRLDYLFTKPAVQTTRISNRARLDLYLNANRNQVKNTLDEFEERRLNTIDFNTQAPLELAAPPTLAPDFLPTAQPISETPRIVAETPQPTGKIASKVIFTPVATIKLPDKNIFVKAVSNKRKHFLNPKTIQGGTIHLPVRGEKLFAASSNLVQRVTSKPEPHVIKPAQPEVLVAAPNPKPVSIPQFTSARIPDHVVLNSSTKPSVPTLNQGGRPPYQPPTTPISKPPITPLPTIKPVEPKPPVINVFVNTQPSGSASTPSPQPQNEAPLPSGPTQTQLSTPPVPTEPKPVTISTPPIIINNTPPTEPTQPVESGLGLENQALKENVKRLADEQSMLQGKLERYATQEKFLQNQLEESRSQPSSKEANKLKLLEEELKKMQAEKEAAVDRAQKLENVITNINTTQPRVSREIVTPQEAEVPKPAQVHVVSARRAEGKMAPPMTTVPNVINGVVKDANGLLLSDTIIVVKDKNDEPVRALKANKVGQFAISTALPNGTYLMEVEKEGYEFDYIEVKLNGEILAPIEIRSRNGGAS